MRARDRSTHLHVYGAAPFPHLNDTSPELLNPPSSSSAAGRTPRRATKRGDAQECDTHRCEYLHHGTTPPPATVPPEQARIRTTKHITFTIGQSRHQPNHPPVPRGLRGTFARGMVAPAHPRRPSRTPALQSTPTARSRSSRCPA